MAGRDETGRLRAEGDLVLIAAQSGRALAAAARRAGLRPLVADLFGDEDTRALADGYRKVEGRFGDGLGADEVLRALDDLAAGAPAPPIGLVLGSGFEASPALVGALASRFRLLGADAGIIATLKDPFAFAALLARLGVPHPAVGASAVPDPGHWLSKRRGASGGGHIRLAAPGPVPPGAYLQRRVPGVARSVAFLADGKTAQVFAVTAQWTAPSARSPFRYAGAVEPGDVPPRVRAEIERAVQGIVVATGLRGLASADCLVDGDAWWLLEINPRPGATLDVLDRRPTPLLRRHVEACLGHLGAPEPPPCTAAASEILYARRTVAAVPPVSWPDHVADRPMPGSPVAAGAPVCTVVAEGRTPADALGLLRTRAVAVRHALRARETRHASSPVQPAQRQRPRGAPRR